MYYIDHYESPIGNITLACDGESLTGLWFDGQKYDRDLLTEDNCKTTGAPDANSAADAAAEVLAETRRWLDIYFDGGKPDFTPPLKIEGSDFMRTVGEIMLEIPYGQTSTYGDIAAEAARRMGREHMSAQAVGGAVGHNSISVIIPCHRVVGKSGSLTGYAGGIDRKIWLLKKENAMSDKFYIPKKGTAL